MEFAPRVKTDVIIPAAPEVTAGTPVTWRSASERELTCRRANSSAVSQPALGVPGPAGSTPREARYTNGGNASGAWARSPAGAAKVKSSPKRTDSRTAQRPDAKKQR